MPWNLIHAANLPPIAKSELTIVKPPSLAIHSTRWPGEVKDFTTKASALRTRLRLGMMKGCQGTGNRIFQVHATGDVDLPATDQTFDLFFFDIAYLTLGSLMPSSEESPVHLVCQVASSCYPD